VDGAEDTSWMTPEDGVGCNTFAPRDGVEKLICGVEDGEDPRWQAWQEFLRQCPPREIPPSTRAAMAEYQRIQACRASGVEPCEDLTAAEFLQCLPIPSPVDAERFEALAEFASAQHPLRQEQLLESANVDHTIHQSPQEDRQNGENGE
jgi:hypothetical protein